MLHFGGFGEANEEVDDDDGGGLDDDEKEDSQKELDWSLRMQHCQLQSLFQQMFYQLWHGTKPTPLAVGNGQYQYGKSRSKEITSVNNRLGTSESYSKVRRRMKNFALHAVAQSNGYEVPVPSLFTK